MLQQTCVLCNAKLETKELLQEHFRKHANKEIDIKGRTISSVAPMQTTQPSSLQAVSLKIEKSALCRNGSINNYTKAATLSSEPVLSNKLPVLVAADSNSGDGVFKTRKMWGDEPHNPGSQKFKTESTENLESSLRIPRNLQSVPCDICGTIFPSAAAAIKHKWKLHPNQPSNFCCSFCGKQFPLKTILETHLNKEHAGSEPEKVVHCEDCHHEFFNEEARNTHAKVAHRRVESVLKPVATPPPSKKIRLNNAGQAESVYYCHLCGTEYILKFNLRKHLEQRHSEEETNFRVDSEIIRCTTCEAIFCNKKAYEVHNLYHQPSDLYVTSEEHRLQIVSRVDQDFDLRRVQIHIPRSVHGYAKQKMNMIWKKNLRPASPRRPISGIVPQGEIDAGVKSPELQKPSNTKTELKVLETNKCLVPKKSSSSPSRPTRAARSKMNNHVSSRKSVASASKPSREGTKKKIEKKVPVAGVRSSPRIKTSAK